MLGFYREGDYLWRDNDIDATILATKEMYGQLIERLRKEGFIPSAQETYKELHFYKDNMLLDLRRMDNSPPYEAGAVKYQFWQFDAMEYRGREYNVPHPVEEYLEYQYGKNWKYPLPSWGVLY